MEPSVKAVVAGAGIGGLTAAIALAKAGVEVEVFESARELAEIGAGLSLWPNAMAALHRLDLEDAVAARANPLDHGSIRSKVGRPAPVWDRASAFEFLGGVPLMVHRAELQEVLRDACPAAIGLHFAARVKAVEGTGRVWLDDGSHHDADLVVGADGIRSAVRASVEPSAPRYTGLTCWRAVLDEPYADDSSLWSADGKQFLAAALTHGRTYVATVLRRPEGSFRAESGAVDSHGLLRGEFGGWDRYVTDVIDAIPSGDYHRDELYFRPPVKQLAWGRVALIGDAAHPVTPDLGQGGCQAIEDAVILGACFEEESGVEAALRRYEAIRLPRVRRVARDSRRIGVVMASRNPLVASTAIRHAMLAWSRPVAAAARANQKEMARHASRQAFLATLPAGG